jgi:hypothetical protein
MTLPLQECADTSSAPVIGGVGKERPILFSAPMVRALLAGTKTQTRRIVKPQPSMHPGLVADDLAHDGDGNWWIDSGDLLGKPFRCPYGVPGDTLWVKETLRRAPHAWTYGADGAEVSWPGRSAIAGLKKEVIVSIHCRRDCSRISLRITDVRVERLNEISEADATAEGAAIGYGEGAKISQRRMYELLWEHINGPGSWAANPWVWAVSFEVQS